MGKIKVPPQPFVSRIQWSVYSQVAMNFRFLFSSCLWWRFWGTWIPLPTLGPSFPQVCLGKTSQIVTWGQTLLVPASEKEGSAGRPVIHDPAMAFHPFLLLSTCMGLNASLLCSADRSCLCSLFSCQIGSPLSKPTWCLLFPLSKMPQSFSYTDSKLSYFLSTVINLLFVHVIQTKCWAPVIFQTYFSQCWEQGTTFNISRSFSGICKTKEQ